MTENKNLIDPFGDDTKESLQEGIKIWNEIFSACPNFADGVIALYKKHGIKCLADSMAIAFKPDVGPDPITKEEPYFYYNTDNETWELRWRHPSDPVMTIPDTSNIVRECMCDGLKDALMEILNGKIEGNDGIDDVMLKELEAGQLSNHGIAMLCAKFGIGFSIKFYEDNNNKVFAGTDTTYYEDNPLAQLIGEIRRKNKVEA